MRVCKWFLVVSVIALCFVGSAANRWWFGGTGNWEVATNWDTQTAPATNDLAFQNSGTIDINNGIVADPQLMWIGHSAGLTLNAITNINSGGTLATSSEVMIATEGVAWGTLNVNAGGTANLSSLRMCSTNGAIGDININGGALTVTAFGTYIGTDIWRVPGTSLATINISNGGTMTVNGAGTDGARMTLAPTAKINLLDESAVLRLLGNQETLLNGYILSGNIIGGSALTAQYNAADNYTYVVPEPATMALIGLGSLALLRKRRQS